MVTFYTKSTSVKENMRHERGSKGNKKIQEAVRFLSALFVFVFFFQCIIFGPIALVDRDAACRGTLLPPGLKAFVFLSFTIQIHSTQLFC